MPIMLISPTRSRFAIFFIRISRDSLRSYGSFFSLKGKRGYSEDDWRADLVLRLAVLTPAQRAELAAWLGRDSAGQSSQGVAPVAEQSPTVVGVGLQFEAPPGRQPGFRPTFLEVHTDGYRLKSERDDG